MTASRKHNNMPGITIHDVAEECGLSVATVSRVLSGSDYPVKPQTRQRILEAAEKTGYVPNMLARGLKTKAINEIAVIIPSIQNPFYTSMVGGIESVLLESAYGMSLYLTDHYGQRTNLLINNLIGKMISGIIIAADSITPSIYEALRNLKEKNNVSIIATDYQVKDCVFPGIYFDYFEGAKMAVEYLFNQGHSRIAFGFCPMDRETRKARLAGVRAACEPLENSEIETDYYESSVKTDFFAGMELARVIRKSDKGYTAIVAHNDSVAVGLLAGLAEQNVSVPDEVSVIGFDDCIYAMMCRPTLTTVRVPSQQMGDLAAHIQLNELGGKEACSNIYLEPKIIERESVRKAINRVRHGS